MKQCNNCGYTTEDDSTEFCMQSGMSLNAGQSSSVLHDENVSYQENIVEHVVSEKKKSKKKKILFICIPVVAVILIAVVVICVLACLSGGPVSDILKSTVNTVEAESFTFKVEAGGESVEGRVVLDFEKKDISAVLTFNDGDVWAIYDEFLIIVDEYTYYDEVVKKCRSYDISDMIDLCFDNWDTVKNALEDGEIDWNSVFDVMDELFNFDKSDAEDHIDLDKASDAVIEAFRLLNDEEWLEEAAEYEIDKKDGVTTYSFDVDFGEIADAADDTFKACLESSDAEDLLDEVVEELEFLDDNKYYLRCKISTEDDYIKEAYVKLGKGSSSIKYEIELSDIGSTTVDTDELKEYLDMCE